MRNDQIRASVCSLLVLGLPAPFSLDPVNAMLCMRQHERISDQSMRHNSSYQVGGLVGLYVFFMQTHQDKLVSHLEVMLSPRY